MFHILSMIKPHSSHAPLIGEHCVLMMDIAIHHQNWHHTWTQCSLLLMGHVKNVYQSVGRRSM